jgi:RNA polymerase sigma-70 factor, ECF subfamily
MVSQMHPSDEELIRAAQAGASDAFGALYERYLSLVYKRVQYVIPEQDVEDVTQEIFIAVIRSLNSFRYEARFSTWLRTLVNRQVADYYRNRNPYEPSLDAEDSDTERLPIPGVFASTNDMDGLDERILLRQALRDLPDHYREIILLRFADGLQFSEISELQCQSLEATKSLFRRAIATLDKQVHDG